ncbi:hypothetical protein HB852_05255 [Listeria grandensis]|uniref:LytR/AlgR family response regulator transcription factor n=1 Tax=Listeria grandensis TaxID=1494963 RepID=UPI001624A929|nr:LytTR family transcriptional regulator DNA-binding domain-containing protein [Listeria grandensis]MBC1474014.1 hypothetical protein [Listeria grandensis]
MQIFIVEDQNSQHDALIMMIQELINASNYPFELNQITAPSVILEEIKKWEAPNIYFIDIDIQTPKPGVDLALEVRELDVHGYIIFITRSADTLYEIMEQYIMPAAYVVKHEMDNSLCAADIAAALELVFSREELRKDMKMYTFIADGRENSVAYDDILYFETISRTKKITMYTRDGTYTIVDFLKNIKDSLSGHAHFSGVNSYVINLTNVVSIDRTNGVIVLVNNTKIYAGRRVIGTVYKEFQALHMP